MSTSPASSIRYHVTSTASSNIRLPRMPEHDASSTAECNCRYAFFIASVKLSIKSLSLRPFELTEDLLRMGATEDGYSEGYEWERAEVY